MAIRINNDPFDIKDTLWPQIEYTVKSKANPDGVTEEFRWNLRYTFAQKHT